MYGGLIWDNTLTTRIKIFLRRAQRLITKRVIRGYHPIAWKAVTALAGHPSWELAGEESRRCCKVGGEDLARLSYDARTVRVLRPVLERWMRRKRKPLIFRIVQIFIGHGCVVRSMLGNDRSGQPCRSPFARPLCRRRRSLRGKGRRVLFRSGDDAQGGGRMGPPPAPLKILHSGEW